MFLSDNNINGGAGSNAGAYPKPDPKLLQPHIAAGHDLIPLHRPADMRDGKPMGKAPIDTNWTKRNYDGQDAAVWMASGQNVGVRLRASDLVVDVDPRNFPPSRNTFVELCGAYGIDASSWPHVHTGGGGEHYYLKKPASVAVVGELKDYPGVEFKTLGRQVVASGSIHPETRAYYSVDPIDDAINNPPDVPDALLEAIKRPTPAEIPANQRGLISAQTLAEALSTLNPEQFRDHDRWLHLMMACHQATNGAGSEEFISWSTSDRMYAADSASIRRRWASLDANRAGGVTIGTLCKELADAGQSEIAEKIRRLSQSSADDFSDGIDPNSSSRAVIGHVVDDWVWVADATRFIRRCDLKKLKTDQWKSLYANVCPDGDVLTAVWKGKIPIRKFESLVYLPAADEIISKDGASQYNLWRPSGIDAREGDTRWFDEHMAYLLPDETERSQVIDYLALLVQRPAEKIHYALLIHGTQGTGKSAIGELMRRIIGERNTVKPSNDEVIGRFTAWQEGAQLGIIEELMMVGRLEAANRLKPLITDPQLRIEDKYASPYSIPNHLNLLCFTNHRNALKIENGDRRWFIVFSPVEKQAKEYYQRLFQHIKSDEGAAAVKHYLLHRDIRLDPKTHAPITRAKEEMRRLSMGEVQAFLLERFEEGTQPFDFDLVRIEDIMDALPRSFRQKNKNLMETVTLFLKEEVKAEQHTRNTKGDRYPAYRLWSIRNHEQWVDAGATGRIEAYMKHRDESAFADETSSGE